MDACGLYKHLSADFRFSIFTVYFLLLPHGEIRVVCMDDAESQQAKCCMTPLGGGRRSSLVLHTALRTCAGTAVSTMSTNSTLRLHAVSASRSGSGGC